MMQHGQSKWFNYDTTLSGVVYARIASSHTHSSSVVSNKD